ncbi:MAG TPA: membrane protein insertion efficiency factor YidD [Alphaproteobacteria bacterium]|nr:membrane protein insertion efficiency factor YidD [Alphaproteobacteria bacterium]
MTPLLPETQQTKASLWNSVARLPSLALIGLIEAYRLLLSPHLGGQCRFHPSCSVYAQEAVRTYGFWRGGWLSARRLGRCHPFSASGFDPVPPRAKSSGP